MLRRKREYIEAFICIAALFVAPVLMSAPAVMRGDLLFNTDMLTTRTPWQEARLPGAETAFEESYAPLIERHYPWFSFLNRAGLARELPLWNPYEGLGAPFLALWRTRALSPFSIPLYLLPLHAALGVSLFLKLCAAGLFAYYAARRFHFTPPFALFIAVTFQWSGPLLIGHWRPASDVLPWFPLMLVCLHRLAAGAYRVWPYIALLTGLMIMGGDPETTYAILAVSLLAIVMYGLRSYQAAHIPGAAAVLFLGAALGAALAAVQLVPYFEFTQYGRLENDPVAFFKVSELSALLAPAAGTRNTGAETGAAIWLPAGITGFLLIPLWLAVRPHANRLRKRRVEALLLTTAGAAFLPMALGSWLRTLPGCALLDVHHFLAPYPLAFALLAATAADEWIHLDAEKCKKALTTLLWLLPSFWACSFGGTYALLQTGAEPTVSPSIMLPALAVAAVLAALLAVTLLWPRTLITAGTLTLVAATTLWRCFTPWAATTPAERAAPETHFIKILRDQNSRVAGSNQLKQWPLSLHGIAQSHSPSGICLDRVQAFMKEAENEPELYRLTGAQALLLTKQDVQGRFAALRPLLNIQEVFPSGAILLKDLQAHPRTRIVLAGRNGSEGKPEDLRASGPPLLEGGALPASVNADSNGSAVIVQDSMNRIVIETESALPGVLVLADAWLPGWRATVDGAPAAVFPVDVAFRGVEIGEGRRVVSFEYRPFSILLGLYISIGAFGVVLIGLYGLRRGRKRA